MTTGTPDTSLDERYGAPGVPPSRWESAANLLAKAELSWLSTVRSDGRPHVTPVLTVSEGATVYFCTGPLERKARNLVTNPNVALTTGCNTRSEGFDLVVEGEAVRVMDEATLQRLAAAWVAKYGDEWRFDVGPAAFRHPGTENEAWVYAVATTTAFGFGKDPYSQTRWRFKGV